jgi:hypothetical protein
MRERWGKRCGGVKEFLGLRVPGVMNFRPLRQQPFTSTLTTPGEGCAAGLGAHARAKTVLILPGALGALQCSFHGDAF